MRIGKHNLPVARVLAAVCCLAPAALFAQPDSPPGDGAELIATFRKQADDAYAARYVETGNLCLRDLIEACPGRWDIARPALERILRESRNGPDEWQEYAARRLIAAYRVGQILATDSLLREAWGGLIAILGRQDRFLDARAEIEELGQATGRDVWVQFLEAELCYRADSYETGARFAEILSRISADDSDPYVRAVWQSIYPTEGRQPNPKYLESGLAHRPGRLLPSTPPTGLMLRDLSQKWEAVRGLPPGAIPSQMHELIGEALEPERMIANENTATIAWLWNLTDRHLLSQKPEVLSPLRQLQQARLQEAAADRSPGAGGPIDLFRRYPWTDQGQRQLLEYGGRELSNGHAGPALRSFRDVLSHAANPALRSEAQVGLWLALAQQDDRGEFEDAFRNVNPEERYPWMGGTETARIIRDRLEKGLPAATQERSAPRLCDLERRLVLIPGISPWPSSWRQTGGLQWYYDWPLMKTLPSIRMGMQLHEDGLLVSAPNLMAWYRADHPALPVWKRTARFTSSTSRRHPGVYLPPVIGGRIYTLWGGKSGCPYDVAAIDSRTGRQLWSTAQDLSWRKQAESSRGVRHWPLSDPVYADGRLYLLAVRVMDHEMDGIYLVCLDPDNGAQLWACVVSRDKLLGASGWMVENCTDLALYGNAVTCHQGAVYGATSAGIVCRVDARDGKLEWAHRYPRTRYSQKGRSNAYPRECDYSIAWGTRPLVAGNRLICMPRDHNGAFALDMETGRLVWQTAFVHPSEAAGIYAGALLARDYRNVVALDLADGATRWAQSFEEGDLRSIQRIGSSLYVGTPDGLCRLDAESGAVIERMNWNEKERKVLDYAILDRALYVVSDEALPTDGFSGLEFVKPPAADAGGRMPFPLRRAWRLARANPQLYVPPPEAGLGGAVFLLSDGVLERLRLAFPAPSVVWQRLVQPDLGGVRFARGMVVLDYPARPTLLDGETGAVRPLDFPAEASGLNDPPPLYRPTGNGNRIGVVNNATGEQVWGRNISEIEWGAPRQVGTNVHVVAIRRRGEPRDTLDVVCSLTEGRKLAIHTVIPESEGAPARVAFSRNSCFCLLTRGPEGQEQILYRYGLDGKPAKPLPKCPALAFRWVHSLSVFAECGPYIALQFTGSVPWQGGLQTGVVIVREDDPSWVLTAGCLGREGEASVTPGFIRGDRYYDVLHRTGTVRVFDLKSGRMLASGSIPSWPEPGPRVPARITDFRLSGDSLVVLSAVWDMRVDVFDAETCVHKGGQVLDKVECTRWSPDKHSGGDVAGRGEWENEIASGPGLLAVTDKSGLQVLVSAERADATTGAPPFPKLYRRREPITADGSLGEWAAGEHVELALRDADGKPASLLLAQDGQHLFAALAYEDARVDPLRGEGGYNDGDWVTVWQGDGPFQRHVRIGLGQNGGPIYKPDPDGRGRTIEATAGIGHDLKTFRHIYELVLPLTKTRTWAQGVLSLKALDDRGLDGPVSIIACDDILVGYHPLTRDEEDAAFALIRELPDLPESRGLYAKLRKTYDAWSAETPPYPPSIGPPNPARAVESLQKYVSIIGQSHPFPYSCYKLMKRFGGIDALPPDLRAWSQRKAEIEAGRQGPCQLSDSLYVTNWLVLGYFPYPPEQGGLGVDFLQGVGGEPKHVPNGDVAVATGAGGTARWLPYYSPGDAVDVFELSQLNIGPELADLHFVVYAACWLAADQDTECELRAGSADDGWKMYLDHEPIGDYSPVRGAPDANGPKVRLERGLHLVLVKVAGTKLPPGAGHPAVYNFSLRVTDLSGGKPAGVTVWN